jgi:membrane-associated phospholipid phosphatase
VNARRVSVDIASRLWWLPLTATGLLRDRGSRGRWLCVPGLVALTAVISTTGKLTIRRPRPSVGYGSPPIGRLGLASSFPSTHAACTFAIAGWMWRSHRRTWLHLLAVTVGYSRVRSRAHHLSDVLAGGALGYAIGRCVDWIWWVLMGAVGDRATQKDPFGTATGRWRSTLE